MARTTPAQNPRGEQSSTLSAGFSGVFIMMSSKPRRFFASFKPRHGVRRPALSSRGGCMDPTQPLYSGHFPIITDDLVLRPAGGRSVEEICHGHTSPVAAEGDRRLAVGPVSYTHLRAHETRHDLVCRLLLEKKKKKKKK